MTMIERTALAAKAICLAGLIAATPASAADYRLRAGDTVELKVAGISELKHESMVGDDGRATFPLVRSIAIAGMTLAEAEQAVGKNFASHLFQGRTPDGREYATAIAPEAVTLTISEYRPIYLNGDVSKPGAQRFRPGMTVRQAVALAGGYELMRFRMNNPFLESADFASEYQTLVTEQAHLEAQLWRLNAELNGGEAKADAAITAPVPPKVGADIKKLASEELQARRHNAAAATAHLEDAVRRADGQVEILNLRQKDDEEGVRADSAEYKRLQEFAQRGQLPSTRLAEARRFLFLSTSQALQTRVQIAQAERERETTRRQISTLKEERRVEILKAIEEATTALAKTRAKLAGTAEKIIYSGVVRSQLVRGKSQHPQIVIVPAGDGAKAVAATEDNALNPGDTVEVALKDGPLSLESNRAEGQ